MQVRLFAERRRRAGCIRRTDVGEVPDGSQLLALSVLDLNWMDLRALNV
jgi:hypothetical protein